jgi:hypothetical protein
MMVRSKSLTGAAILQFLLSTADAIGALPILAAGTQGRDPLPGVGAAGGPPFWAGVFFLVFAIAGLFGAYGLWINQKWGKVIAVTTRVVVGLFALGDILSAILAAKYGIAMIAVVYVLVSIFVIMLVLRREYKPALA